MKPTYSASTTIFSPQTRIFTYITTVKNFPAWTQSVATSGAFPILHLQALYYDTFRFRGHLVEVPVRVVDFQAPNTWSSLATHSNYILTNQYLLSSQGDQTHLTINVHQTQSGYNPAPTWAKLVGQVYSTARLQANLLKLKTLLESNTQSAHTH